MGQIPPPDYWNDLPNMDDHDWRSTSENFDLGWVSGLFKVAEKSIGSLYSGYNLTLNEEDILDLNLDFDEFVDDGIKPFVFAVIWLAIGIVFTVAGLIWFCCNKCMCCCRSSFKGRGKDEFDNLQNTDPHFDLGPRYSKRNEKKFTKPSTGAIVIAVLMTIWLISLLIMLLHTFGANEKTKQGIDRIQPDLQNSLIDIIDFIGETLKQLEYAFGESYLRLDENVRQIDRSCSDAGSIPGSCSIINRVVIDALGKTENSLREDLKELTDALNEVDMKSREAKAEMDDNYDNVLNDVNKGLYWFFMLFNLLYLAVFFLVLIGTVLAIFAAQRGLKLAGYLLMRIAIVMIFLMGIFIIIQMVLMFIVGGVISEVVCPAIRGLEVDPNNRPIQVEALLTKLQIIEEKPLQNCASKNGEYVLPTVGQILRSCKREESAYKAFNLVTAFDINCIDEIMNEFQFPGIPTLNRAANSSKSGNETLTMLQQNISPEEAARQIQNHVRIYTDFVKTAVTDRIGKCHPAYNALDNALNLFCYKVSAPIISFWWILQFIFAVLLLIIITVLVFERLHF